ncbi:sodium:proton antiporter [Sorangium cellulosum]|uniref:Na(+)/H(+) antiporter NhaA n=1 Tax=Sorangium cellulosum TaxID=56 RepID=A0A2L0ETA1_SORCE|nr:Na+/H+ antiporter NhaA [Sorangium cellulosum]AUX42538.1 sodium:proton antiporter [Sorangium cellulosum]
MNPSPSKLAPGTWAPARRIAERVLGPLDRFLHVEAASGLVLLVASVIALAWANSPWGDVYEHLWHTPVTVGVGALVFTQPVHFWINEGPMTIFFFVVGLEIRREIHEGELSDLRRATLPIAAAIGGMVAPALLYLSLNPSAVSRHGWGVPTATDIAFAVGVLALLGKRVPPALRVLLLALAIIDDIGAIIVIALFYSSGVAWSGLLVAAGAALGVVMLQRFGVRQAAAYVVPGGVLWWGMLRAGVHPTIAGVVIGLMTPARSWFGSHGFLSAARDAVDEVDALAHREGHRADELLRPLGRIRTAQIEAVPPVLRLQAALHPWVAYGIMPLFAFANAGVRVDGSSLGHAASTTILLGVALGLVAGKPIGVFLASFTMVKLGVCALPRGVGWRGIAVVGCVAGIGFTMAIFIAGLAFDAAEKLAAAKLGVLVASASAAVIGLLAGRFALPAAPAPDAAKTLHEAETSTEH